MTDAPKWYDAHLAAFQKTTDVNSMEMYQALHKKSIEQPDDFWAEAARKYLSWEKEWAFVLQYDFNEADIKWFGGGVLNACYNCLDRHLADKAYVAGDEFTMGDIPLGPQLFRWYQLVDDAPDMPHLKAWYERLTERPAYRTHCMNPLE